MDRVYNVNRHNISDRDAHFPAIETHDERIQVYCSEACRDEDLPNFPEASPERAAAHDFGPETMCAKCWGPLPWPDPLEP